MAIKKAPATAAPLWPWAPVELELHEISAIKAMAAQHPVAFACLVDKIAGRNRISFTAGGEDGRRATDFAEGKRWVAETATKIVAMKMPSSVKSAPPSDLPNSLTPGREA